MENVYHLDTELLKQEWKFKRMRNAMREVHHGSISKVLRVSQTFTGVFITQWKHGQNVRK